MRGIGFANSVTKLGSSKSLRSAGQSSKAQRGLVTRRTFMIDIEWLLFDVYVPASLT